MSTPYDTCRYRLMTGAFNWVAAELILIAWSGVPAFFATDTTIAQVKAHGGVTERGRSLLITGKTVATNGVAQSDPVVIPTVAPGDDITHFTIALDNAVPDNAVPLVYVDDVEGLPYVPNGLDIIVQPDWSTQQGWWRA